MKLSKGLLMTALITGCVYGGVTPVFAEENVAEFSLDPMVVTATKMQESTFDTPRSASVITSKDLEKLNIVNLDEAFVRIPGIFAPRMARFGNPSYVSVRGAKDQNSNTILINGMKVNCSYNGNINFSSIPINNVERIEVLRGPASSIYGSGAMGSVINVVMKEYDKSTGNVSVSYGSNATEQHNLYYNAKVNDKFSFDFGYEKKRSHGIRTEPATGSTDKPGAIASTDKAGKGTYIYGMKGKRQWNEDNYSFSTKYKFDADRDLTFRFSKTDSDQTFGKGISYIGEEVTKSTYLGTPSGKGSNIYSLNYKDKENGWNAVIGYADQYKQGNYSMSTKTDSKQPNNRVYLDVYKELELSSKDKSVIGINYSRDKMESTKDKAGVLTYSANAKSDTMAVYFNNVHSLSKKWELNTGLRYDRWETEGNIYDKSNTLTPNVSYSSKSKDQFSPAAALEYKPDEKSNIYLSWAKSFEAPTLYRLYSSSVTTSGGKNKYNVANPDLDAQTANNFELGVKKKIGDSTNVNVAVFKTKYEKMLYNNVYEKVGTDEFSRYENAGKADAKGFEIELNHDFSEKYTGFLNYTYQDAKIKDAPTAKEVGKRIVSTPQHIFRTGILYNTEKWTSALTGEYVSKRFGQADNSDTNSGVYGCYDPYFVMNLSVGYNIKKDLNLTFSINNLLDRDYVHYYYQPGRTYEVQMTYKF